MKRILLLTLLVVLSFGLKAQTQPSVLPSPRSDSGFAQYNWIRALNGGIIFPTRDTLFTPTYIGSVIFWRNPSADTALWVYAQTTGRRWYRVVTLNSSVATGTVTSVGTNNGTGITGGAITVSGTLAIDTSIIATRLRVQKGIDSIGFIKLNISDTSAMLLAYLRKSDTSTMLLPYVRQIRTINTLAPLYGGGDLSADRTFGIDTGRAAAQVATGGSLNKVRDSLVALISGGGFGTVLSVATTDGVGIISSVTDPTSSVNINLRVDTVAISTRAWRQKGVDSVMGQLALKLNISDTAAMLANRLKISDTATMLTGVTLDRVLANGNTSGRSITVGSGIVNGNLNIADEARFGGSSGGQNRIFYDEATSFIVRSDFDTLRLQAGSNNSNFRDMSFYIGDTRVAYIDRSVRNLAADYTLTLTDNTSKFATTSFVKGQGYLTSAVTSVGLSVPSFLNVSGSPITTSGTITVGLANQNANLVFASPTTGSPAQPSFRSLVNDDLPTVSVSKGGTGLTSLTANRIPFGQGTSAFGSSASLTWDGTFLSASNFVPSSSTGTYSLGGSSGGGTDFYFDGTNKVILQSDFDSLRFQAGVNDANKRFGNFYTGNTRVAYWADDGFMYLDPSITLTDNSQKFATTAFVKGQGYLTSGSALSSATGTANQVLVNGTSGSAQTGAITLTTPQSIGTSSNVQFGTLLAQASSAYSSGTTYGIASNPTTTFSGTLPTSGVSFSSILAPFNNVISDNTTVNGNTPFGAVLASNSLSFSNTSYRTLTMSASGGGLKANSALIASTFDAGTERGAVTNSAGIMINGIFKSGTYSLKRTNHYQLLINPIEEFGTNDSVTNKWGIYQGGSNDANFFAGSISTVSGFISTRTSNISAPNLIAGMNTSALNDSSIAILMRSGNNTYNLASLDYYQRVANQSTGAVTMNVQDNGGKQRVQEWMRDSSIIYRNSRINGNFKVNFDQNATTEISIVNADNTNSTSRARLSVEGGTVQTVTTSIATLGGFIGTSSNHDLAIITNGSNRITVSAAGDVTAPNVYTATVGGTNRDVFVDNTGLLGYVSSFRASKKNIQPLSSTSWLHQLKPVTFNYRKRDKDGKYTDSTYSEKEYGLIAEEVEPVNKEMVFYDVDTLGNKTLRGVSYSKLVIPILAETQIHKKQIDSHTSDIWLLKQENIELKKRIAALESIINKKP